MRGRKLGHCCDLSIDEVQKIVTLTNSGISRPQIAKEVGRSTRTVYLWQKRMDTI